MALVTLDKDVVVKPNKDGKDRTYKNLILLCGDTIIPIDAYEAKDKHGKVSEKTHERYLAEREVLFAFCGQCLEFFKETGTYDDEGTAKYYIRFYLVCGSKRIRIEGKYFANENGEDKRYAGRKAVMSAFATPLPVKSA